MKTANSLIDIFYNLQTAMRAFNKCEVPCMLLYSDKTIASKGSGLYYLDKSKTALKS